MRTEARAAGGQEHRHAAGARAYRPHVPGRLRSHTSAGSRAGCAYLCSNESYRPGALATLLPAWQCWHIRFRRPECHLASVLPANLKGPYLLCELDRLGMPPLQGHSGTCRHSCGNAYGLLGFCSTSVLSKYYDINDQQRASETQSSASLLQYACDDRLHACRPVTSQLYRGLLAL